MSKDTLKKILKNQTHPSKATKVAIEEINPLDFQIIDVREDSIFNSTPHIQGAINIHSLEKLKNFCLQHRKEKILLTCNGGLEASKYGTMLIDLGFENIYFLDEYLVIIEDYLPLENNGGIKQ